jgi:predicted S18 family serine protease
MKSLLLITALLAAASLVACDKPVVVETPTVAVPGPAGPAGPTGASGVPGTPGEGTTVIVIPPAASAASN